MEPRVGIAGCNGLRDISKNGAEHALEGKKYSTNFLSLHPVSVFQTVPMSSL